MYCTLGTIEFELHTSPTAESDSLEISYAEMELINQPTKLQPTGRSLLTKEFEIYLNQSFCKVADQIKALNDAATNYDALALLYGNGKLAGDFVITSIGTKTEERDMVGNLIAATLTVTLKEFIADKLQTEQNKANKDAFATGDKKGVTNKKTAPPKSCKNHVSDYASKIKSYQVKENADFRSFLATTDAAAKATLNYKVRSSVASVKKLSETIKSAHATCLTQYSLTSKVDDLIAACTTLTTAMLGVDTTAQSSANLNFQNRVAIIHNASTVANAQSITRKPA